MIVGVDLELGEHRAEQYEVSELRMNEIAVNSHVTEAGLDRDRLMRDDPWA
jgi:hypothetical protein